MDGRVVYRAVGRADSLGGDDPTIYATLYRRALKQGKVSKVGEGVIRGRRVIVISGAGYSISESGIFRALTEETDQSVWNFTCLLGRFRHRKPGSHQLFLTPSDALAYIQALYDW